MSQQPTNGIDELVLGIDDAVRLGDVKAIAEQIKVTLSSLCACRGFTLPENLTLCSDDSYARRLLHHNKELNYTAVVMTWGPGQGTGLHDHAGMWCVECVVEGELEVTQYDLQEEQAGNCRFKRTQTLQAGVGDAGCLIPPYEYHVLTNARQDRKAVTLHIYGGEMDHCNVYQPADEDWWRRETRSLSYNC